MFDLLDKPYDSELTAFGEHWCGPERYGHWVKTLIAEYRKDDDGDGKNVKVYCTTAPARFYTLEVEVGENSVHTPKNAYYVSTGGGQEKLAATIAQAISDGMLEFSQEKEEG